MTAEGEYREASEAGWSAAAEAWARAAEKPDRGASADAAAWMLERAALRPGEDVLELAAGAARVGLQAAELVGPGGRVVCSDFAESMVEATRLRIERHGVANAEARQLDAERLELADGERFDAVLCRFGYMLMADPATALEETHRALRPGGRLALAVWGPAERNPWLASILLATMEELNAPPPPPGTPGPFALGDTELLDAMLRASGFAERHVEALATEQPYDSIEAWWDEILEVSGPLATILKALAPEQSAAIRGRAEETARQHVAGGGEVRFPAEVVVAHAVRPPEQS